MWLCREFERYLLVSHYLCVQAAAQPLPELHGITAKISVSLLRYTDLLPADRTFYQAGSQCKVYSISTASLFTHELYHM